LTAVPSWSRRLFVPAPASITARASLFVKDLLFPPRCSGCGERGVWLCERCILSVPAFEDVANRCARCGVPVVAGRCGCAGLHPRISSASSALPYVGWVAEAVRGAKYEGERDRAAFLGCVLAASRCGDVLRRSDVVVPVPMYRDRQGDRGYNQAELIAESACRSLGIPVPRRILVQTSERASQVGLSASARRTNVKGSFAISPDTGLRSGLRIVVVDDVRTTGATLTASVDALRQLRPARVDVVTVAAELPVAAVVSMGLPGTQ